MAKKEETLKELIEASEGCFFHLDDLLDDLLEVFTHCICVKNQLRDLFILIDEKLEENVEKSVKDEEKKSL